MQQVHQQQQRQSPGKITGSCFRCHKPGHWAITCPDNPKNQSPISQPVNSDGTFPSTHCRCGGGLCEIKISTSQQNPNKKYYSCPGKSEMDCGYFKWCIKLRKEEIRKIQPNRYPICGCEAGICIVNVEEHGVNAGRTYFACRIKKGYGACNFKQWLGNSPEYMSFTSQNLVADQSCILDEFELTYEAEMVLDAIEIMVGGGTRLWSE